MNRLHWFQLEFDTIVLPRAWPRHILQIHTHLRTRYAGTCPLPHLACLLADPTRLFDNDCLTVPVWRYDYDYKQPCGSRRPRRYGHNSTLPGTPCVVVSRIDLLSPGCLPTYLLTLPPSYLPSLPPYQPTNLGTYAWPFSPQPRNLALDRTQKLPRHLGHCDITISCRGLPLESPN